MDEKTPLSSNEMRQPFAVGASEHHAESWFVDYPLYQVLMALWGGRIGMGYASLLSAYKKCVAEPNMNYESTASCTTLRCYRQPMATQKGFQRLRRLDAFVEAASWVTGFSFNALACSLLAIDLVSLQFSDVQYNNSNLKVLTARSSNHDLLQGSLLSHWGNDLPTEPAYYLPALFFITAIAYGFFSACCIRQQKKTDFRKMLLQSMHAPGEDEAALASDALYEWMISKKEKLHLYKNILDLPSMVALAQLPILGAQQAATLHLRDLQDMRSCFYSPLKIYLNYLLWSAGLLNPKSLLKSIALHTMAHIAVSPIRVWLMYQFYRLYVTKTLALLSYLQEEKSCAARDRVYSFQAALGAYHCTACDTPLATFQQALTAQGCLDALWSTERSFETLLSFLQNINPKQHFTTIDLSRQNTAQWNPQQWQQLIHQLLMMSQYGSINELYLSSSSTQLAEVAWLGYWSQYIEQAMVTLLSLSGQSMGMDAGMVLGQLLNNSQVSRLNLSDVGLGDEGLLDAANGFSSLALNTLDLSGNKLSGESMRLFFSQMNTSQLEVLYLARNQFDTLGWDWLSYELLNASYLYALDLSGNDFTLANAQAFAQNMALSSVRQLWMSDCSIADQLVALSDGSFAKQLHQLWLAHNDLSDVVAAYFCDGLVNSSVQSLALNHNALGDQTMEALAQVVAGTDLEFLDLSHGFFSALQVYYFIKNSAESPLRFLNLAENQLDDPWLDKVSWWLMTHNESSLEALYLSDNQFTPSGMVLFLQRMLKTNIRALDVSNHPFGDVLVPYLQNYLQQADVYALGLDNTELTGEALMSLIPAMVASNLSTCDLDNNRLGLFPQMLAKQMIAHLPDTDSITETRPDVDVQRLIAKTHSSSDLMSLSLKNTGIDISAVHAYCRIAPTNALDVTFSDSNQRLDHYDWSACEGSSSQSVQPGLISFLIPAYVLLCGTYSCFRHIAKILEPVRNDRPGLFSERPKVGSSPRSDPQVLEPSFLNRSC